MNRELLLLAALNRLRNKPDAVEVVIAGKRKLSLEYPALPVLEVNLVNRYPSGETVAWREGGNYRHGRSESFSFEVSDSNNKTMPIEVPLIQRGGIVYPVALKKNQKWKM